MTSCVWASSVKTSGGRRRREEEAEEADGMQNQKQEPHTKMWGKRNKSTTKPGFLPGVQSKDRGLKDFEKKTPDMNRNFSVSKKRDLLQLSNSFLPSHASAACSFVPSNFAARANMASACCTSPSSQ